MYSELRQIQSASEKVPDPTINIHPQTARELGIADGDWAWVETRRGRIKQKARLTEEVDSRMVHAQHGWWFPEMPSEDPTLHSLWQSNVNVLCTDDAEYCSRKIGAGPTPLSSAKYTKHN